MGGGGVLGRGRSCPAEGASSRPKQRRKLEGREPHGVHGKEPAHPSEHSFARARAPENPPEQAAWASARATGLEKQLLLGEGHLGRRWTSEVAAKGVPATPEGRAGPVGAWEAGPGSLDRPRAGPTQALGVGRAARCHIGTGASGKMAASPGRGRAGSRKGRLWVAVGAGGGVLTRTEGGPEGEGAWATPRWQRPEADGPACAGEREPCVLSKDHLWGLTAL